MNERIVTPERCSLEVRRGHSRLAVYFASGKFRPGRFEMSDALLAHPVDAIVIGDPRALFGFAGIPGVGEDFQAVLDWVGERVAGYDKVVTIGTSMGAAMAALCAEQRGLGLSLTFGQPSGCRVCDISSMVRRKRFGEAHDEVERLIAGDPTGRTAEYADFIGYLGARAEAGTRHIAFCTTEDFSDRLHGWRLDQLASYRVYEIPNVLHPGLGFLWRRGHFDDLMRLFVEAPDPAAAMETYCERYFDRYLRADSRQAGLQRHLRRTARKLRRARDLNAKAGLPED